MQEVEEHRPRPVTHHARWPSLQLGALDSSPLGSAISRYDVYHDVGGANCDFLRIVLEYVHHQSRRIVLRQTQDTLAVICRNSCKQTSSIWQMAELVPASRKLTKVRFSARWRFAIKLT
jgi:hypothetical protein